MNSTLVLGIDVGTTNLKLVACDQEGRVLAETAEGYGIDIGGGGVVTQDPRAWWEALDGCMRRVGGECDLAAVRALAISCQGETLVCCDERGEALEPAISWMDTRARTEKEELERQRSDWYARTGKRVASYSTLAKMLWLKKHRPDFFRGIRRFCQVQDYLMARLTGRWICDLNNASFTSFCNVRERRWDDEIGTQYGLAGLLPEVAESGTVAGMLLPEWTRRWGLSERVQVVLGGHDQGCAALGSAPPGAGSVILSTGTAWVLYCPLDQPRLDPDQRIVMYGHAWPGMWTWLASYSGGGVLDTFIDRFCRAERQEAAAGGQSVYRRLIQWEHLSEDLLVIPYMFGANTPEYDSAARAAIVGLGPEHGPKHIVMGIVEAIGFETRRNLELFRRLGAEVQCLKMMGGASRSELWPQLVADICDLPVDVMEQSNAAPLGAAFLAGQGIGLWPEGRLPSYPGARRIEPDPRRRERLRKKFVRYMNAVEFERERRGRKKQRSDEIHAVNLD